ncbi:MAG: alpha-amylase/4-alpha-glucanotransferase domain-containing protein [Planctomycetota bacterium]
MSDSKIRLCLVLHNHQPVGNFDGVFEEAYQDSYLPFLEVFEPFEELKISLHTSGPLMQWLQVNHPEYLSRLAQLVESGRIEIIGGAFYEPILTMIPRRDRVGQISSFSKWLEERLCPKVKGMWMPERVWESNLASAIAEAGIEYTVLDDYHFRRAGLKNEQLSGYYVAEDEGRTVNVFPGSERLRYLIPFAEPQETIDYCRMLAEQHPDSVVVFGDDGEKFGTWPNTKEHVYQNGWLQRFFEALTENREWLLTTTLEDAVEHTPPRGKIYLPDASYREMTEWALPVNRQIEFDELVHQLEHDPRWSQIQSFMSGGFWRNFKVKYPETNEMYSRMMYVSGLFAKAMESDCSPVVLAKAQDHLYQGQCNCSYWHGAFGGIYLPHLRNAVYYHLIIAETLLEKAMGRSQAWVEATADDYNFDGRQEIRLANDQLSLWVTPAHGGQLYELDVREIGHNLGATIQRRQELYHAKVLQGENEQTDEAASIHDRVVFKQADLDERLQYDSRLRNMMIDHFWDDDLEVASVMESNAMERGDFADGEYVATIRRKPERIQILMTREGNAWGVPLTIKKGVTLDAGSDEIEIAYVIDGLPPERQFHFGVEFNFAGLPEGQDDRFFSDAAGNNLGHLGSVLDLESTQQIKLTDGWLGLEVDLQTDVAGGLFAYPVQTVSQSESGFELVHQSVCVQPHWMIEGDADGRWVCRMTLKLQTETSTAQEPAGEAVVTGQ